MAMRHKYAKCAINGGVAYERAISTALDTMLADFQKWKQGWMTPFDLDEKIHQYHNGAARELYKQYATGNPDMAVIFAPLNEDCRSFYQDRLDWLRD
jgi:hypothetical protein